MILNFNVEECTIPCICTDCVPSEDYSNKVLWQSDEPHYPAPWLHRLPHCEYAQSVQLWVWWATIRILWLQWKWKNRLWNLQVITYFHYQHLHNMKTLSYQSYGKVLISPTRVSIQMIIYTSSMGAFVFQWRIFHSKVVHTEFISCLFHAGLKKGEFEDLA